VLAQLGFPTLELPVLYALAYPERLPYACRRFDPVAAGTLTFEPVRGECFPAFALGVAAGRAGGTNPAVFNAANEVAVAEFLAERIPFGGIADSIADALERWPGTPARTLDDVREADAWARRAAHTYLTRLVPC
jgi:1-deoxy-D-xylulose-5-phosphate reductoisomerase